MDHLPTQNPKVRHMCKWHCLFVCLQNTAYGHYISLAKQFCEGARMHQLKAFSLNLGEAAEPATPRLGEPPVATSSTARLVSASGMKPGGLQKNGEPSEGEGERQG